MTGKDDGNNAGARNLTRSRGSVSCAQRGAILSQSGCVVWLTGLSGSGKTTIARGLEKRLVESGHLAFVLDGDNLRCGLNSDLGFSPEDRQENIRRVGEVAALFAEAGIITITAFISPYRADRRLAREKAQRFFEIHVDAPLEICRRRDPKGLYAKAVAGEIEQFTGIDAPYEEPEDPELALQTEGSSPDKCAQAILDLLEASGALRAPGPGGGQ
jgi:adenylylsulfate kinase